MWDFWTVTYGTQWLPDTKGIWSSDADAAKEYANEALAICYECVAPHDCDEWLQATIGEGWLILRDDEFAPAAYRKFVDAGDDPWKMSSTCQDAQTIAAHFNDRKLARIFGDPEP